MFITVQRIQVIWMFPFQHNFSYRFIYPELLPLYVRKLCYGWMLLHTHVLCGCAFEANVEVNYHQIFKINVGFSQDILC